MWAALTIIAIVPTLGVLTFSDVAVLLFVSTAGRTNKAEGVDGVQIEGAHFVPNPPTFLAVLFPEGGGEYTKIHYFAILTCTGSLHFFNQSTLLQPKAHYNTLGASPSTLEYTG